MMRKFINVWYLTGMTLVAFSGSADIQMEIYQDPYTVLLNHSDEFRIEIQNEGGRIACHVELDVDAETIVTEGYNLDISDIRYLNTKCLPKGMAKAYARHLVVSVVGPRSLANRITLKGRRRYDN